MTGQTVRQNQISREGLLAAAGVSGGRAWEVVAGTLAERFSCRAFLPDPLPRTTIERLVGLAQLSATWCNAQPWRVAITEGAGTERFREAIYAHADTHRDTLDPDLPWPNDYPGVYATRRKETAWQLYESVGVAWGDRTASRRQTLENFRLFGAPHVMIVTTERALGTYGVLDCGFFVSSFLTLAQASGIATIPQAAFAIYSPFVREHFGIPDDRAVVCGVSFGLPDHHHPANAFRTRRAPLDEVVDWHSA